MDQLEELLHKFRRTPQTCGTMPSTYYATVRAFVAAGKTETLMRVMEDTYNYGLFPDDVSLVYLVNHFVKVSYLQIYKTDKRRQFA